jgi:hypothetical protein
MAARNNALPVSGCYVSLPGYMLTRADVPQHAVITGVGSHKVTGMQSLVAAFSSLHDGAKVPLRFFCLGDAHRVRVAVIHFDRRWYEMSVWTRNDVTGLWTPRPCPASPAPPPVGPQSTTFPPISEAGAAAGAAEGGEDEDEEYDVAGGEGDASTALTHEQQHAPQGPQQQPSARSTVISRLYRALVMVELSIPQMCDGVASSSYVGCGIIVDKKRGLVVTDRNTIPVPIGDVTLTFAASLEIPGSILFLHPVHNFTLLQYDPALIGDTPVTEVALAAASTSATASKALTLLSPSAAGGRAGGGFGGGSGGGGGIGSPAGPRPMRQPSMGGLGLGGVAGYAPSPAHRGHSGSVVGLGSLSLGPAATAGGTPSHGATAGGGGTPSAGAGKRGTAGAAGTASGALRVGDEVLFVGLTPSQAPITQKAIITKSERIVIMDSSPPRYREYNADALHFDRMAHCLGGVFVKASAIPAMAALHAPTSTSTSGGGGLGMAAASPPADMTHAAEEPPVTIGALWASYAYTDAGDGSVREMSMGMPTDILADVLRPLRASAGALAAMQEASRAASAAAPSAGAGSSSMALAAAVPRPLAGSGATAAVAHGLLPALRSLDTEFKAMPLSKARQGFSLPPAWVSRLEACGGDKRHVLAVRRCLPRSHAHTVLKEGDLVLAVNGRPVVTARDVEIAVQYTLPLSAAVAAGGGAGAAAATSSTLQQRRSLTESSGAGGGDASSGGGGGGGGGGTTPSGGSVLGALRQSVIAPAMARVGKAMESVEHGMARVLEAAHMGGHPTDFAQPQRGGAGSGGEAGGGYVASAGGGDAAPASAFSAGATTGVSPAFSALSTTVGGSGGGSSQQLQQQLASTLPDPGAPVEVTIFRDGAERTERIVPSLLSGFGTDRIIIWAGLMLQTAHEPVEARGFLPMLNGSPPYCSRWQCESRSWRGR